MTFGSPVGEKGNVAQGAGVTNLNLMGNDVETQLANMGAGIQGAPFNVDSTGTITNKTDVTQHGTANANETANFAPQSGGGL